MLSLFGRRHARETTRTIEAMHADIVAAARNPIFYTDYGVADTFEGRFEMLVLLSCLVLRKLNVAEAPGPEIAQELVDTIFRHLDPALRELGVGDLAVPKRMKRLAEAFLGRSAAYDRGLVGEEPVLAEALRRNVLAEEGDGGRLARFTRQAAAAIADMSLDDLLRGPLRLPDPAAVR